MNSGLMPKLSRTHVRVPRARSAITKANMPTRRVRQSRAPLCPSRNNTSVSDWLRNL